MPEWATVALAIIVIYFFEAAIAFALRLMPGFSLEKQLGLLSNDRGQLGRYDALVQENNTLINECELLRRELREHRKYWGFAPIVHAPRELSRLLRGKRSKAV